MKRLLKYLLFTLVLTSGFILVDCSDSLSEVDAGQASAPAGVKVTKTLDNDVKLTWDKVENASSYKIFLKKGETYVNIDSINDKNTTSWIHKNLPLNEEYVFVIKTRNKAGVESDFSKWVSIYLGDYDYTNLKGVSLSNFPTKLEVNKRVSLSSFLHVVKEKESLNLINNDFRWYSSDGAVATVDSKGVLKTNKPGKVTIGVMGHNGVSAHFTLMVYEKKKNLNSVKPTTTHVNTPKDLKAKLKSKRIKLTWERVTGANKYEVYRKKRGKFYKVATVVNNSFTEKKLKRNKQYYYKIKAVKTVSNKTYKSAFSEYASCYIGTNRSKYTNLKKVKFLSNPKKIMEKSTFQLKYTILKQNSKKKLKNKELRWFSSNKKIATVDKNGKVTSKSYGKVTIYVKGHNGVISKYKLIVDSKYANKLPVLTFHRIVSDENKKTKYPDNQWVASVKDFEEQMKYLYDNNYKTINAEEFENWYYGRVEYPKKTVMLTFDDGDYELYYLVLPVLKKYNFKATAFIIGSYTGDFTINLKDTGRYRIGKDVIKKVSYEYPNLDFQSHTYNLHYKDSFKRPIVYSKNYDEIMDDFRNNESFGFEYLAYPFGARTPDFVKAAEDSGMRLAFKFATDTYATRKDPKYEISRVKINGQITYDKYLKKMQSYLK